MKNTWIHSAALVAVAAVVLMACRALADPAAHVLADSSSQPSAALSMFDVPLDALSQLLPGLALGWFTRRHPLLVGAAAGIAGMLAAQRLGFMRLESYALVGEVLAVAMTVAVAALAGRALRRRFDPASVPAAAR